MNREKIIDLSHTVEHGMVTYKFHAVPVKIRGFSSFPVRAYAVVEK